MAYSVNWATKVVTIPKVDLTVASLSPEIYTLDLIAFWAAIHDIQDGPGMPYRDIMRSNAPVSLSGVTYARSVEVINGYRIEFEDGEYQVNLTNANNNILDTRVQNNVSVNASNSAGLVVGGGSGGGLTGPQNDMLVAIFVSSRDTRAILFERLITDFVDGKLKLYNQAGVVTHEGHIYHDIDGVEYADGTAPIVRRNALTPVP